MTFGESLVFLVALLSGILDSIAAAAAGGHGDNIGTSSIGISALNQYFRLTYRDKWLEKYDLFNYQNPNLLSYYD